LKKLRGRFGREIKSGAIEDSNRGSNQGDQDKLEIISLNDDDERFPGPSLNEIFL
jgi:hypothetical protein